jgi:hypothetical protein
MSIQSDLTLRIPYDIYLKFQDGSSSLGDELVKEVRKARIKSIKTDRGEFLLSPSGVLHSNLFDSEVIAYVFTPIDNWNKPIREKFTGERWDSANYIGLVFTHNKNQYVVSGQARVKIDITNTDFETDIDKVTMYEDKLCEAGMGWRSRYFNCKRPTTTSMGNAVYSHYDKTDDKNGFYITHIKTKNGLVDYYLGESADCVEKLDSIVNFNVSLAIEPANDIEPIDVSQMFAKLIKKEDQMSLF